MITFYWYLLNLDSTFGETIFSGFYSLYLVYIPGSIECLSYLDLFLAYFLAILVSLIELSISFYDTLFTSLGAPFPIYPPVRTSRSVLYSSAWNVRLSLNPFSSSIWLRDVLFSNISIATLL